MSQDPVQEVKEEVVEVIPAPVNIEEDLIEKVQTVKQFATIYNLLALLVPINPQRPDLIKSLEVVKQVHADLLDECLNHHQAEQIPELAKFFKTVQPQTTPVEASETKTDEQNPA